MLRAAKPTCTRQWAKRLTDSVPGMNLVVAEDADTAAAAIVTADAVFGTLPPELLAKAQRLRWLRGTASRPPGRLLLPRVDRP